MKTLHTSVLRRAMGWVAIALCAIVTSCQDKPKHDEQDFADLLSTADSLYYAQRPSAALGFQQLATYMAYDDIERQKANMELAQTHYYLGDIDVTRKLIDECIAYFDTLRISTPETRRIYMEAIELQADMLDKDGNVEQATELFSRAADIAHQIGDNDVYINNMLIVYSNMEAMGQYGNAVEGYNELLQLCGKMGRGGQRTNILNQLITAYLVMADNDMAEETLETMESEAADDDEIAQGLVLINKMRIAVSKDDKEAKRRCAPRLKAILADSLLSDYFGYDANDLLAMNYLYSDSNKLARPYIENLKRLEYVGTPEHEAHYKLLLCEYHVNEMEIDSASALLESIDSAQLNRTNISFYRQYFYVTGRVRIRQDRQAEAYQAFKQYAKMVNLLGNERLTNSYAYESLNYRRDTTIIAQHFRLMKQESTMKTLDTWRRTMMIIACLVVVVIVMARAYRKAHAQRKQKADMAEHNDKLQREVVRQTAILKRQEAELKQKRDNTRQQLFYAGQIQRALLPNEKTFTSPMLEGNFVLFKPCSTVSGDFYWGREKDGKMVIACADATGHGVPGAIIAMMYATMLSNIGVLPREKTILKLLTTLDENIHSVLSNNESLLEKDCVDISIMCIDNQTGKVSIGLARHNAYVVKHGTNKAVRISGVRRSVGDTQPTFRKRPFVECELNIEEGDMLYLTTDGYESQISGRDGKKMRRSSMEDMMGSVADKPLEEQKRLLNEYFEAWRGDCEQTDDVLVMGFRFGHGISTASHSTPTDK